MTLVVDHSGKVFSKKRPSIKDLIANHEELGVKSKSFLRYDASQKKGIVHMGHHP